ncbi:hypothetical protein DsansV1_C09g0091381 [Dioscorea sansibarensis]
MKDTIRCCISCILPCGSLDVIRIVHANGRVEEITHSISAAEVMQLYPKHVLRRPPSAPGEDSATVPPNSELQRGKIYFLTPVSVKQEKPKRMRRKGREGVTQGVTSDRASLLMSNRYLLEILSEKAATHRDRRRGRVGIWRPHLESISEISADL